MWPNLTLKNFPQNISSLSILSTSVCTSSRRWNSPGSELNVTLLLKTSIFERSLEKLRLCASQNGLALWTHFWFKIYWLIENYINDMEGFVSEVVSRAKIGYRRQQQKRPLHIEIDMCMITWKISSKCCAQFWQLTNFRQNKAADFWFSNYIHIFVQGHCSLRLR